MSKTVIVKISYKIYSEPELEPKLESQIGFVAPLSRSLSLHIAAYTVAVFYKMENEVLCVGVDPNSIVVGGIAAAGAFAAATGGGSLLGE